MSDQTIKADAGKLQLSLVPTQAIRDIAKLEEFEMEQLAYEKPFLIKKTTHSGHNWKGLFRCNFCGKEFEASISNVVSGRQRSCGCAKGKLLVESKGTHGASKTRLYRTYMHIEERCNKPYCAEYKHYGARGIRCEFPTFESFREFALKNGYTDSLTVERMDVNGNYSPENIIFIPAKMQQRNTRRSVKITYKGLTLCAAEWAQILGVKGDTLTKRIREGWGDAKTLETHIRGNETMPNISLVPVAAIEAIRETRLYGVGKYGDSESWRRVEPQRYIEALYRHLLAVIDDPLSVDEESGLSHVAHMACNAAFLCELLKERKSK